MGVDRGANDFWQFGRSRIELLSEEEAAEVRRRTVPRPPFGMPEERCEDQPTEMWLNTEIPGKEREDLERADEFWRRREAWREAQEAARLARDEFLDTIPGLDPRCRAKR